MSIQKSQAILKCFSFDFVKFTENIELPAIQCFEVELKSVTKLEICKASLLLNRTETLATQAKIGREILSYLFSIFETSHPLLCFPFSPYDGLLFYVAQTAGFRLRSFSYYAYVNLHALLCFVSCTKFLLYCTCFADLRKGEWYWCVRGDFVS